MLGLRLDEPAALAGSSRALDLDALERLARLGLAERRGDGGHADARGRFAAARLPRRTRVTAELAC